MSGGKFVTANPGSPILSRVEQRELTKDEEVMELVTIFVANSVENFLVLLSD